MGGVHALHLNRLVAALEGNLLQDVVEGVEDLLEKNGRSESNVKHRGIVSAFFPLGY